MILRPQGLLGGRELWFRKRKHSRSLPASQPKAVLV